MMCSRNGIAAATLDDAKAAFRAAGMALGSSTRDQRFSLSTRHCRLRKLRLALCVASHLEIPWR